MTEDVRTRLENLRDRTSAESLAEVIRHALSVYDTLSRECDKGCRVVLVDPEVILGPGSRELLLVH
jgi:hypothetical protein